MTKENVVHILKWSMPTNYTDKAIDKIAEMYLKENKKVLEEYAQQVKPDTIETVNPHGYLLEGRYVSFEDMKNRTNFEELELIPLYLK